MQEDKEKGFNMSKQESFNLLYALAKGHATCFTVFFRRNFGSEALGWPGLIALVLQFLIAGFGRVPDMLVFTGIWVIALACQRVSTMKAMRRGVVRHSRYAGDVDTRVFRNRSFVKFVLEPLVCVVVGVCLEFACV